MWEGVIKVEMKVEPGERMHIRTHRRLLLRYFVDLLID